ncbi:MAG: 23S rRNA (pseudouridine(1915)-N(3))-methyltransferase RlmH [Pseudomonadota bacterium]|nr:23S rRNA (pseudouridine(1915)-N(3))-methyltransferase RlmH [Pseudomonadota bacterium]
MRIHLLCVTHRVPAWVKAAFEEYAKRLPPSCRLGLVEIRATRRHASADPHHVREEEASRLLKAVPGGAGIVALDEHGEAWTTPELARHLSSWTQASNDVALLIGGADGLARRCLQQANHVWSLSALTLPHALVRVIVAEQIYRAWSLLQHHPYHRAACAPRSI